MKEILIQPKNEPKIMKLLSYSIHKLKAFKLPTLSWLLCLGVFALPQQTFAQSNNFLKTEADFMLFYVFILVMFAILVIVLPILAAVLSLAKSFDTETKEPLFDMEKFWLKMANLKPLSKEKELLLHENYDGIQELDNPVPMWFNALFYGTIAFGLLYWFAYHNWQLAPLQEQEYDNEVYAAQMIKAEKLKNAPADNINEENVKLLTDASVLNAGKGTYIQYCAACHGKVGEGMVGPNLTDEFWLHGGSVKEIFKTIKNGVPDKGMVAWGSQLTPTQISNTTNYILSLKGTNPPNAKAPQGNKVAATE